MADGLLESHCHWDRLGWVCECDFCTGAKHWADNWCPRCGDVKLEPPKWWENLDICAACEADEQEESNGTTAAVPVQV